MQKNGPLSRPLFLQCTGKSANIDQLSLILLLTIGQIKWNQINNAVVGKWVKPLTVQGVDNQTTKTARGGEREEVRVKTQLRNRRQIQGKKSLKN